MENAAAILLKQIIDLQGLVRGDTGKATIWTKLEPATDFDNEALI